MEKIGFIEIRITGSKGNIDLSPDNYDIREIVSVLENAENLLYPGEKRNRPTISYKIEEGSVKHILKTSIQYIIGFNAIIGQINNIQNIDFLDLETAKAQITVTKEAAGQARESLRIIQKRYHNGLAIITELLDNETALLKAKLENLRALYDYKMAWAQMKWAAGVMNDKEREKK